MIYYYCMQQFIGRIIMAAPNVKLGMFVLGLACMCLTLGVSVAQSKEINEQRTLSLQGVGKVNAAPDTAILSANIVEIAPTAAIALKQNSEKLSKVFDALKKAGIEKKYIQTSGLRLTPVYKRQKQDKEAPKITAYKTRNGFSIKVVELEKTGDILDTIVTLGINKIDQIRFTISDMKPHMNEARKLATQDALDKAKLYAETAGFTLGNIRHFSENSNNYNQPRPMMMEARMMKAAAADVATPISGGELTIQTQVSISWDIE